MIFRDIELDFDLFDADTAEAYEAAVEHVQTGNAKKSANETLSAVIRRQCHLVFDFFDDLFGDGFHKQLFGERTNLMECMDAFEEFIRAVNAQKAIIQAECGFSDPNGIWKAVNTHRFPDAWLRLWAESYKKQEDVMSIYEIISLVAAVVLGVLSLTLNTSKKLNSNVSDYIAKTEYLFSGIAKSGDKKFAWVADRLYELIPAVLRPIFTRAVVEGIVQRTFDAMEKYGKSQVRKGKE